MDLHEIFHGLSALSSFARLAATHPEFAVPVLVALVVLGAVFGRRGRRRGALIRRRRW